MKKIFLACPKQALFLVFIMITISYTVTGDTIEYSGIPFYSQITDYFEYPGTYASNGWTVWTSGGCGLFSTTPETINSTHEGFGVNHNLCGIYDTMQLTLTNYFNVSETGRTLVFFDYVIGNNDTNATTSRPILDLRCGNGNTFVLNRLANNSILLQNGRTSGADCQTDAQMDHINNATNFILIDINPQSNVYNLYINGDNSGCSIVTLGTDDGTKCFDGIRLNVHDETARGYEFEVFDNIRFYHSIANPNGSIVGVGEPCTSNEDCVTGKCEFGECTLKGAKEGCTYDYECMSNDCINSQCKKPSTSQLLDASKDELFGSDQATSNIISLLIIMGLVIGIIFFGRSIPAVYVAGAVGVVLTFFFTFLGWLSLWIMFGELFVMLLMFVLIFIAKPGS